MMTGKNRKEKNLHAADRLLDDLKDHLSDVNKYREVAGSIDHQVIVDSERDLHLDDLPYGEENVRTEKLPSQLSSHIGTLEEKIDSYDEGEITEDELNASLEIAEQALNDSKRTLDDCTPIPKEDPKE